MTPEQRDYARGALRALLDQADSAAIEPLPGLAPAVLVGGPLDRELVDLADAGVYAHALTNGYRRTDERASLAQLYPGRFTARTAHQRAHLNVVREVWRHATD